MLNSLNFYLSEILFISPSILNEILFRYSNLGCRLFPFTALNISYHSLLACRFLLKGQLLSIWGLPCMLLLASPLLLLIFFLVFSLCQIDQYESWCVSPWIYPLWSSLCLLDLIEYFIFHVGEIFNYNLFKNFFHTFFFISSYSEIPIN